MIRFGTQEFFDELRRRVNSDDMFRKLGRDTYTASELIVIEDLGIGIWQKTSAGLVTELLLVGKKDLKELESKSDIIYYVDAYDTMVSICTGDESFVSMVIDDRLRMKGPLKLAMSYQGASERMEEILKATTEEVIIPTSIQYRRWASDNGYL